jgi:hypothetical protein
MQPDNSPQHPGHDQGHTSGKILKSLGALKPLQDSTTVSDARTHSLESGERAAELLAFGDVPAVGSSTDVCGTVDPSSFHRAPGRTRPLS